MLRHIELKFFRWIFLTNYRLSSSFVTLCQFLKELCFFWNLEYRKYTVFRSFLPYALTYWAEILHITLLLCTTDYVRVSSLCVNVWRSYPSFGTKNIGNAQFSPISSCMLWHIEMKFCTWLCFNVLQSKFECCHFVSIFIVYGVNIWEEVSFYISTTWWVSLLVDQSPRGHMKASHTVVFAWFVAFESIKIFRVKIDWNCNSVGLLHHPFSLQHLGNHFSTFCFFFIVWLRITDKGSLPEMRIWSILLIKSELKWCKHLSRSLFLYFNYLVSVTDGGPESTRWHM